MPWWIWVSALLAWGVLAVGVALWLGAAAAVVRRKEHEAMHRRWEGDPVDSWRDAA